MAAAIIILVLLGLLDAMLFLACFEMEKDEEERKRRQRRNEIDRR